MNPNYSTFVTNFNPVDCWIYEKAIQEYGDETIQIAKYSIGGMKGDYSLHHTKQGDMSDFWNVFNKYSHETVLSKILAKI